MKEFTLETSLLNPSNVTNVLINKEVFKLSAMKEFTQERSLLNANNMTNVLIDKEI